MRRRGFLQRVTAGAGMLVAGSLPYALARFMVPPVQADPRAHLRPPGALADDAAFVEACIGCGLCGEVCPPRCILFHARDGAGAANTPYIDPAVRSCILCKKCMLVCPTEALTDRDLRKIDMGIAQIDRSACYPWVDKGVCGVCVSVCPLGDHAIGYDFANFYRPVVKQGCVGCGQCVEVCPEPSLPIGVVPRAEGTVVRHSI